MYYIDFHLHSTVSPDAANTMTEMALAEVAQGIDCICFTDHAEDCVTLCEDGHQLYSYFLRDKGRFLSQLDGARTASGSRLDIRMGVELSSTNQDPEKAAAVYADPDLDFVIGSVHNATGKDDYYFLDYSDRTIHSQLLEEYLQENLMMIKTGHFDVLGHLGYVLKYMHQQGHPCDFSDRMDIVKEIFTQVIHAGKGIELNTSGMRATMNESIPSQALLQLYRSMGGEIITVGSDSHSVSHVTGDTKQAYDLLKTAGFKYVTAFKQHKPEFIKLL